MSRGRSANSGSSSFGPVQALDARTCSEVGARLAEARAGRQWSLSDIAERLLLSTAQVHGIEHADASAFHNTTYFALALRKYATLMAIPCPDAILTPQSSPGIHETSDPQSLPAAQTDPKRSLSSMAKAWLAGATIVVLTGAGVVFYVGRETARPVARDAEAATAAPVAPPATVDRADASLPEPLATSQTAVTAPIPAQPSTPLPTDSAAPGTGPDVPQPVGDAPADMPVGVVTLAQPAWVFVRYADNSVIERTLKAGQSLALTSPPIYLAIGAGEGVTLTIRQRPVDLSAFRSGREIRIGASDLSALGR